MKTGFIWNMKLSSAIYYAAFICFCAAKAVGIVQFAEAYSGVKETLSFLLQITSLLFLFAKFIMQRYSPSNLGILFLATILASYCSLRAGSLELLWAVLFIGASQDAQIRTLASISLVISICSILLTVSMWSMGLSESIEIVKQGGAIQGSFGYTHPNQFGKVLMSIVMSLIALSWGKIRILRLVLIIGIIAIIQLLTGSRTAAMLSITALLICIPAQRASTNMLRWLTAVFAASSLILSLYFMYYYGTQPWHYVLDEVLSNRLHWMHYYISNYGLSLFGQGVDGFESLNFSLVDSSFLVDNSFAFILIRFGIIVFLAIPVLVVILLKSGYSYSEPVTLVMLGLAFLVGFSERYFFQFDFNYFLIAFGGMLYGLTDKRSINTNSQQKFASNDAVGVSLLKSRS